MPPLYGPRAPLCCTRYPRTMSSDPSSRLTGTCTLISRCEVLTTSWSSSDRPISRAPISTYSLTCSKASAMGRTLRLALPAVEEPVDVERVDARISAEPALGRGQGGQHEAPLRRR